MPLLRPTRPVVKGDVFRRHALAVAVLSVGLTGCAGTPTRTGQPAIRASASLPDGNGEPTYVLAPAYSLVPGRPPLKSALNDYYEEWAGVPYRYGGTSKNGIDCSAFVRRTLAAVTNRRIPRTTAAQVQLGRAITRSELSVGDLVFFRTGPNSRHVGIYIGNGRFMHASSSQGVTISELSNIYWRNHYWQARRLRRPATGMSP